MNKERLIDIVSVAFAVASIAVAITIWTVTTFQTQAEAQRFDDLTADRLERQKEKIISMDSKLNQISEDVSYIRGRLEGKN